MTALEHRRLYTAKIENRRKDLETQRIRRAKKKLENQKKGIMSKQIIFTEEQVTQLSQGALREQRLSGAGKTSVTNWQKGSCRPQWLYAIACELLGEAGMSDLKITEVIFGSGFALIQEVVKNDYYFWIVAREYFMKLSTSVDNRSDAMAQAISSVRRDFTRCNFDRSKALNDTLDVVTALDLMSLGVLLWDRNVANYTLNPLQFTKEEWNTYQRNEWVNGIAGI